MVEQEANRVGTLLEAVAFAARAHQGQLRQDQETPYASHVFRACLIVGHLFGVSDRQTLTAAVLHDVLEDTTTDFDDLEEHFGREVASWVAALSKDKRRPEPQREAAYEEQLKNAPWQVKVCKLADVYDNLSDLNKSSPEKRARSIKNAHRYLNALKDPLSPEAQGAWRMVSELLARVETKLQSKKGSPATVKKIKKNSLPRN